jgi:hypothetical protein
MALVVYDRVQETTATTGTGTITLGGAVAGYQSFAVVGNGNTTFYCIVNGSAWEVGIGTYTSSGTTLARTTVLSNSSGNTSPITLVGASNVFVTYPAGKSVNLDASGNVGPLGTIASGVWNGTTIGVAYGGTGVTTSSGASSVVLRDANQNVTFNNFTANAIAVTSAAGTTTLTAASARTQILIGSLAQTFQLPNATTLVLGQSFIFVNNSSGVLTVTDNASATVELVPSGGVTQLAATSIATSAGTWGAYSFIPAAANWGTNSLALASTVISGGTWQGGTIQSGYGGTGLTTFTAANNALYSTSASALAAGTLPIAAGGTAATTFTANGVIYGNSTSALGVTAAGTTGQVLIATTSGAPSWGSVPTTAAVTSLNFGTTGLTPATATTGAITVAGTLVAANGGTGQSSYAVGDLLYASTTTALSKLADVATGNALISGGVGVAPSYGKIGLTTHVSGTLPVANGGTNITSYTVGDILYASAAGVLSSLADVATGNVIISGGVGVAPSYGKVGLTTHVSGTLPLANGGTNATTAPAALTNLRGWTTTATAAGTTTLTNTSTTQQEFTGTLAQTVVLPVTSTLALGWAFEIINNSTGSLTIQSSGLNTIATLTAGTTASVVCVAITGTTAASWDFDIDGFATETGTGSVVRATSPTLVSPALGTPSSGTVTNLTGTASININGTVGATTATTGAFTTLSATGAVTLSPANLAVAISPSGTGTVTISPVGALTINPTAASTINNTSIGATTASTGRFTTVTSTVATGTAPFTVASTTQVANLNAATAGTAAGLSATLVVGSGGTGTTTAPTAGSVVYGASTSAQGYTAAGTSGQVLVSGAAGSPTWTTNIAGNAANVTGTVAIANGGTGQTAANAAYNALSPMTTTGDMEYRTSGSIAARLAIGTTGQVLTVAGGIPSWATPTPAAVSDQNNTSTGYFDLPVGTTAQRPASPADGMTRYNTSLNQFEVYQNGGWVQYVVGYLIDYLVVAGGGGGASGYGGIGGGGGGAGGYIAVNSYNVLQGGDSFAITIGAGGAGAAGVAGATGTNGTNSVFGSLNTALGGGYSANFDGGNANSGGSGGGGTYNTSSGASGTSGQGQTGANGNASAPSYGGGGGGGALNAGIAGTSTSGGAGGNGGNWQSLGTFYAGGGGGGGLGTAGTGGSGGGGNGGSGVSSGTAGTVNTGGGGGGGATAAGTGGAGGSGRVIIRYLGSQKGTGGTVTSAGGYTYHTFTTSGTYTA